jgi:hypothetical protein
VKHASSITALGCDRTAKEKHFVGPLLRMGKGLCATSMQKVCVVENGKTRQERVNTRPVAIKTCILRASKRSNRMAA